MKFLTLFPRTADTVFELRLEVAVEARIATPALDRYLRFLAAEFRRTSFKQDVEC